MDDIRKYLEETKSKIIGKSVIALPPRFKKKEDCVDLLICLFQRQLLQLSPNKSAIIIPKAIFRLLQLFNIFFISEPGIRQRMIRAKRKSTQQK